MRHNPLYDMESPCHKTYLFVDVQAATKDKDSTPTSNPVSDAGIKYVHN